MEIFASLAYNKYYDFIMHMQIGIVNYQELMKINTFLEVWKSEARIIHAMSLKRLNCINSVYSTYLMHSSRAGPNRCINNMKIPNIHSVYS